MTVTHFEQYAKDCQRIKHAISYLPECDTDAVFAAWDAGKLFLPAWKEGALLDWWVNVAAHMSVAAVLGYKLALFVEDDLEKEALTSRDVVEALLIHDWAKRLEVDMRTDDPESVKRTLEKHKGMLLQRFSKRIVALAVATGDNGVHITETRLMTLGEKIVFYSDYCTSGSRIVTFQKRLEDWLPQFADGGRYAQTNDYYQKQYGMSHHEKITKLLSPIQVEFIACTSRAAKDFPKNLVPPEFWE